MSFRLHGVDIRSPLPLDSGRSGGQPAGGGGRDGFVVQLELEDVAPVPSEPPPGETLVSFSVGEQPVYGAARQGDVACLRMYDLCDFEVGPGRTKVRCRPSPDADPEAIALVARGAFLAFLLGLGGECVLHASAVSVGDRAVVFVGGSGRGKSTLAAWACTTGAAFVSDDLLRIDGSDVPRWVGRSPELRLRASAQELVTGRRGKWDVRSAVDGRLTALPPVADEATAAIGAVVVPLPSRQAHEVTVEQLDSVDAVLVLAGFPRLEGWRLHSAIEAQLDGAARLTRAVPVFVVTVPWGPPFPSQTMETLLARVLDPSVPVLGSAP